MRGLRRHPFEERRVPVDQHRPPELGVDIGPAPFDQCGAQRRVREQPVEEVLLRVGGEVGRVSKVYEEYVGLELAENVEVTVQKSAIQLVLPKGTIKSIK